MTSRIILIRHGQTDSNVEKRYMGWLGEEGLNEIGIQQTHCLAERLRDINISAIYSSPLPRALETAKPLAQFQNLEVIPNEGIGEMRMGPWKGLSAEEIEMKYPQEWKLWRTDPVKVNLPNRETLNDLQNRVVQEIDNLVKKHPNQSVLLVTHDGVIRVFIAHVVGSDASIYRRIAVKNASISIVNIMPLWKELELLNDTYHLH